MKEDRKAFCDELCKLLRMTRNAGRPDCNPLVELRFIETEIGEFVRPIFEDGTGENGYYDVNVTADSNMGILKDVCDRFIFKRW